MVSEGYRKDRIGRLVTKKLGVSMYPWTDLSNGVCINYVLLSVIANDPPKLGELK